MKKPNFKKDEYYKLKYPYGDVEKDWEYLVKVLRVTKTTIHLAFFNLDGSISGLGPEIHSLTDFENGNTIVKGLTKLEQAVK